MSKPYDGYIDRTMAEIERLEDHGSMSRRELREFLSDAWDGRPEVQPCYDPVREEETR